MAGALPEDCLVQIFSYLESYHDITTASLVCMTWNEVAESEAVWETMITRKYNLKPIIEPKRRKKNAPSIQSTC
jgi:hypothetical protein